MVIYHFAAQLPGLPISASAECAVLAVFLSWTTFLSILPVSIETLVQEVSVVQERSIFPVFLSFVCPFSKYDVPSPLRLLSSQFPLYDSVTPSAWYSSPCPVRLFCEMFPAYRSVPERAIFPVF
eukprot:1062565_1